MKYKSEVVGKNGISARIVAKSTSAHSGQEIVTFEYEAPKCILAEIATHNMLVKNAQSSRAVPTSKVLEQIRNHPVTPVHWGSNQAGMVAGEEIDNNVQFTSQGNVYTVNREDAWKHTAHLIANLQESWGEAGYHKQIVNRIGEAFTMVKGVITGTEFDNFFHLRYHKDADPYIRELAKCMWEAYEQADAEILYDGEWHTPYVDHVRCPLTGQLLYGSIKTEQDWVETNSKITPVEIIFDGKELSLGGMVDWRILSENSTSVYLDEVSLEQALKTSAAACGQVSYRKLDLSEDTVERVWDRLMGGDIIHASVTGHQASPMKTINWRIDEGAWVEGVTHIDREGDCWSAQFKHWIMHRKLIPNESFKGKFVPPKEDNK